MQCVQEEVAELRADRRRLRRPPPPSLHPLQARLLHDPPDLRQIVHAGQYRRRRRTEGEEKKIVLRQIKKFRQQIEKVRWKTKAESEKEHHAISIEIPFLPRSIGP